MEMEEGVRDGGDGGGCQGWRRWRTVSSALSPCVDRGIWHPGHTGFDVL